MSHKCNCGVLIMFFKSLDDLPDHIQGILPKNWQELYFNEFNSAYKNCKNTTLAHKIAWGLIETVYPKEKRRLKGESYEMPGYNDKIFKNVSP